MGGKKLFIGYHNGCLALVSRDKASYEIEKCFCLAPEHVNPLYNLESYLEKRDWKLVFGLETRCLVLRSLELQLTSKREILAALPFQVEEHLPYDLEETLLLPKLFPKKESTEILLLATSQSNIKTLLESTEADPDIVSSIPHALFRYVQFLFPDQRSFIAYHHNTTVVSVEGQLRFFQSALGRDLDRVLAFVQKRFPNVTAFFSFGKESVPSPCERLLLPTGVVAQEAIAIGLALDAAKNDEQSCQFRIGKNLSFRMKESRKKGLKTFLYSCAAFFFCTLLTTHLYVHRKERAICHAIELQGGTTLKEALSRLESQHSADTPSGFSPSPVPKVHEVLTYFSTHPELDEEGEITHFRYEIHRHPRLGGQNTTHIASVELEIECDCPAVARALHNALLHETKWIDQKEPIRWSGDHGIYKASFFLKPKRPL